MTAVTLDMFLTRLGERQVGPANLLMLGGSGLILLGRERSTLDIDFVGDEVHRTAFQDTITSVATELDLHADPVPIERFVPLPADTDTRRVFVGRFGQVDVFVIDPYVIALSKLDRGFDDDIADIVFLVQAGMVDLDQLAGMVASAIPQATQYDLDVTVMRGNLAAVRKRARA